MTKKQAIQLFEEKKVRIVWDEEQEKRNPKTANHRIKT